MNLSFFSKNAPECPEDIALNILSLLDPKSQLQVSKVNNGWNKSAKDYWKLLESIKKIPYLSNVALSAISFRSLAGGMTNTTYKLKLDSETLQWVLRIPGTGSSAFINRKDESHNAIQASGLGLNVPIKYFDNDGLQLTQFVEKVHKLDNDKLTRKDILKRIADMMKQLHTSMTFDNTTHYFERNEELLQTLKSKKFKLPTHVDFIEVQMNCLKNLFARYKIEMRPCHNDTTPLNFMLSYQRNGTEKKEIIHEIDWEYSSNNDYLWDLVYFMVEAKLNEDQEHELLAAYFGEKQISKSLLAWVEVYKPIIEWWITIWSWTQIANEANAVEQSAYAKLGNERYKNTLDYLFSDKHMLALLVIDQESTELSGCRSFEL